MSIAIGKQFDSKVNPLILCFNSDKNKTGLNNLPPELLARIFSFLMERERFYGSIPFSMSSQVIQPKGSLVREIKSPEVTSFLVCKNFEVIKNYCKVAELLHLQKFIELIEGKIPEEFGERRLKSQQEVQREITSNKEKPDLVIVRNKRHYDLICALILILKDLKKEDLVALTDIFSKVMFQEKGIKQPTKIDSDLQEFAKKILKLSKATQEWYQWVQLFFTASSLQQIPVEIAQNMHLSIRVPKLSQTIQFIQPFIEYDKLTILKFLAHTKIAPDLDRDIGIRGLYYGYLHASVAFLIFKERGLLDSVKYQLSLDEKILTRCIHLFIHELADRKDVFDKYKEETSHEAVQNWFTKLYTELSAFLARSSPLYGFRKHSLLLGIAEKVLDVVLRDEIYSFVASTMIDENVINDETYKVIDNITKKIESPSTRQTIMRDVLQKLDSQEEI